MTDFIEMKDEVDELTDERLDELERDAESVGADHVAIHKTEVFDPLVAAARERNALKADRDEEAEIGNGLADELNALTAHNAALRELLEELLEPVGEYIDGEWHSKPFGLTNNLVLKVQAVYDKTPSEALADLRKRIRAEVWEEAKETVRNTRTAYNGNDMKLRIMAAFDAALRAHAGKESDDG